MMIVKTKINDSNFLFMNAMEIINKSQFSIIVLQHYLAKAITRSKLDRSANIKYHKAKSRDMVKEGRDTIARCKALIKHYLN